MLYQVKDWQKYFENSKSRERKECSFVCVPNKQHGLGLALVLAEPDGLAIYGVWCLILGACSQQRAPREGWLTSDGHQTGTPWAPGDLALKFRRSPTEIDRALTFLSSPKIGWLNAFDTTDATALMSSARVVPADCPPAALERKKEEKEGREDTRAHEDEPVIPTVKEIADHCAGGIGIPASYCEHYHTKKTVSNGWIKNGRLVQWRIEIVHWWKSDRATWNQRKVNGFNANTDKPNPRNAGIGGDAAKRTAAVVAKVAAMQQQNAK
jgi:hypothetical protein